MSEPSAYTGVGGFSEDRRPAGALAWAGVGLAAVGWLWPLLWWAALAAWFAWPSFTVAGLILCHRARSRGADRSVAAIGLWAGYLALGSALATAVFG